jgi:hypothetical protein
VVSFDAGNNIADYTNVSACQGGLWRVELFVTLPPAHALNCMHFPACKYDPCHLRYEKSVNTKLLKEQFADFRFALRVLVNFDSTFGCW